MIKTINIKNFKKLLICLAISLGTGAISSIISQNSRQIYDTLIKPPFSPPGYLFGIVWTILYILIGVASFFAVKDGIEKPGVKDAVKAYFLNLFLLFIWPIIFFNFNAIFLSVIVIIITLFSAVNVAYKFYQINKTAGYLYIPLVLWILFATVLNISIWWLNR